jgi:phosphoadenosine phosphosulfate reductase
MLGLTQLRDLRTRVDTLIVSFSCGKDSLATLDVCARLFPTVHAVFGYVVQGLSFQETVLHYCETRYGLSIYRLPHWELSEYLASATFRMHSDVSDTAVIITPNEFIEAARSHFQADWVASGERINDSVWRRGMIKAVDAMDPKRRRVYPIADWTTKEVLRYLEQHSIPLPPEYPHLGHSFGGLYPKDLLTIKQQFPDDYDLILDVFPLAEAAVKRYEWFGVN